MRFTSSMKYILLPVIVSVTGSFFSCTNSMEEIMAVTLNDSLPDEYTEGLRTVYTEQGKAQIILNATKLERYYSPKNKTILQGPFEVVFYTETGEIESTLSAEYGEIIENENLMIAKKNVVFHNSRKEQTLETEELVWNQKTRQVNTDQPVLIKMRDGVWHGIGMTADETFSEYRISDPSGFYRYKE